MANVYVRSGAAGAGTGADWANAYTTLAAALTAKAAGDSFWVSEDHAETQASAMTLTAAAGFTAPTFVYCVNHAGSVPPVSADLRTAATISTTGNNGLSITSASTALVYFYGVIFQCGDTAVSPTLAVGSGFGSQKYIFTNCGLKILATGASSLITFGATNSAVDVAIDLINTPLTFSAAGQGASLQSCDFRWKNTANAIGGTVPTTLWKSGSPRVARALFEAIDFSAAGSGKTLIADIAIPQKYDIKDCKLGASVTVAATPSTVTSARTTVVRSDSGATNYRTEVYDYLGTQTVETTIVRTGGASDGTTNIAWKLVTTANSKWVLPFEAPPIAIWNDSTSAITTLTIYGTTTGGGVPNNDDIWVDVEYLGSGSTPQGSFITSTKADLAASGTTNNSSDASTWAGSGAGNGFKIVVPSFTPGMKGPINITVKAAKVSTTYYIDPKPSISGVTVSKSEILSPGVYANELTSGGGGISRARAASGF